MTTALTVAPAGLPTTFLNAPLVLDLDALEAQFAILGIPYGMPYRPSAMANDQSRAPDAIRQASNQTLRRIDRYDWDLGGTLLDGRDLAIVDCGNVTAVTADHKEHYRRAEQAARKIFRADATLVALGGDHGVSIPVMRALEGIADDITLVHVDAHMAWRDQSASGREGYRSPIRRVSEMPRIGPIVQIGIRGIGSLGTDEIDEARAYGGEIITAYELHEIGMEAVLARLPDGGPYYLTIDADGLDPTIMPAVMSPAPGGPTWFQIHCLIHALTRKGRVLGMDLVEVAPRRDVASLTMVHAESVICNFIGACARAGYHGP